MNEMSELKPGDKAVVVAVSQDYDEYDDAYYDFHNFPLGTKVDIVDIVSADPSILVTSNGNLTQYVYRSDLVRDIK